MSTEAIAERIAPVGQGYTAMIQQALRPRLRLLPASSGPRDGETVFKGACFACRYRCAGAPKRGDSRLGTTHRPGVRHLAQTRHRRLPGKAGMMPPVGTCATCSDEEIENAIHYMIDKFKW